MQGIFIFFQKLSFQIVDNHIIAPKGTDPEIESYSVLMDNTKQVNKELVAELRQRAITDVYVCGLAYDLCAGSTAMDAQSFGYRTMVVEDATRCVCHEKTRAMKQGLLNAGCLVGKASEVSVEKLNVSKLAAKAVFSLHLQKLTYRRRPEESYQTQKSNANAA